MERRPEQHETRACVADFAACEQRLDVPGFGVPTAERQAMGNGFETD